MSERLVMMSISTRSAKGYKIKQDLQSLHGSNFMLPGCRRAFRICCEERSLCCLRGTPTHLCSFTSAGCQVSNCPG